MARLDIGLLLNSHAGLGMVWHDSHLGDDAPAKPWRMAWA